MARPRSPTAYVRGMARNEMKDTILEQCAKAELPAGLEGQCLRMDKGRLSKVATLYRAHAHILRGSSVLFLEQGGNFYGLV